MDRLFEFLFKYKPIVFSKGQIAFSSLSSTPLIILFVLAVAAAAYFLYFRTRATLPPRTKAAFIALRSGIFLVLLFCLLRPIISISSVIPQQNFVAILIDDSKSMSIKDAGDKNRAEVAKSLLIEGSPFYQQLSEKFKLRFYKFSSAASRLETINNLSASGTSTNLSSAIETALSEFTGLPLSAIVVLTDGNHNAQADLTPTLNSLKAKTVPLYVVGFGSERFSNEVELVSVNVPRAVLKDSMIVADASIRSSGQKGQRVNLSVAEDGKVIKSQEVTLKGDGEIQTVKVEFTPLGAGIKNYNFSINPLSDEIITNNNAQNAIVNVQDDHPRILYIEGEPRWEYGKLRAALREEKNIELTSVIRTAEGKFYRQGVENEKELMEGFPTTKEELFKYKGLVIGSIEANFFNYEQLKGIEEFVSKRGGGLLMLGGKYSFSAGGYAGTPVADALPVNLKSDGAAEEEVKSRSDEGPIYKVTPSARGQFHPTTRLSDQEALNAKMWSEMPRLTIPEMITSLKPGATLLLEGYPEKGKGQPVAVLAYQRYGRGRSLAFTPSDSWRWRMELESRNLSHELFWKQLLRYLVNSTPDQVTVETGRDAYEIGDQTEIIAEVNDKLFEKINTARVTAKIISPGGKETEMQLGWSVENGGSYRGTFVPDENGAYKIEVNAQNGGETVGIASASFLVTELNREYYNANQNADLLKRLALESDGRYYTEESARNLPEEITYLNNKNSMRVTKDLWDMPIVFLLLIGLVSAEWLLRRQKGLS